MTPTDYFISAIAHTSAITAFKMQSCAITIQAGGYWSCWWIQGIWDLSKVYPYTLGIPIYPEWPHRQGGCLACCGCTFESRWGCTDLYYARGAQRELSMRVGGVTSQLDLPSLTSLSVAGCGWLQLGVSHWAASVHYCKQLIIDPTFCGSRFSTGRLLAIEDFTFTYQSCWNVFLIGNCGRRQESYRSASSHV